MLFQLQDLDLKCELTSRVASCCSELSGHLTRRSHIVEDTPVKRRSWDALECQQSALRCLADNLTGDCSEASGPLAPLGQ